MLQRQKDSKEKWLEEGYRQFAICGPDKLSVNQISKEIGSARASFYHYFGDTDIFIDELLARHWRICAGFNKLGKEQCKVLFPDLYLLLGQYTTPLQFNLQLFHNRHCTRYNYLFLKTYTASANDFALQLLANHLDLNPNDPALYNLWITMGEAWYSRLNPNDLSANTLQRHSEKVLESITSFINSNLFSALFKNY